MKMYQKYFIKNIYNFLCKKIFIQIVNKKIYKKDLQKILNKILNSNFY